MCILKCYHSCRRDLIDDACMFHTSRKTTKKQIPNKMTCSNFGSRHNAICVPRLLTSRRCTYVFTRCARPRVAETKMISVPVAVGADALVIVPKSTHQEASRTAGSGQRRPQCRSHRRALVFVRQSARQEGARLAGSGQRRPQCRSHRRNARGSRARAAGIGQRRPQCRSHRRALVLVRQSARQEDAR